MSTENKQIAAKSTPFVTLDTWAVLLALVAAVLIRFGVISRVPW